MKNTMRTSGKCEYSKKPGNTSHTYNIMKYINILTTPQKFYKLYVYNRLSLWMCVCYRAHWRSEDNLSWGPQPSLWEGISDAHHHIFPKILSPPPFLLQEVGLQCVLLCLAFYMGSGIKIRVLMLTNQTLYLSATLLAWWSFDTVTTVIFFFYNNMGI